MYSIHSFKTTWIYVWYDVKLNVRTIIMSKIKPLMSPSLSCPQCLYFFTCCHTWRKQIVSAVLWCICGITLVALVCVDTVLKLHIFCIHAHNTELCSLHCNFSCKTPWQTDFLASIFPSLAPLYFHTTPHCWLLCNLESAAWKTRMLQIFNMTFSKGLINTNFLFI